MTQGAFACVFISRNTQVEWNLWKTRPQIVMQKCKEPRVKSVSVYNNFCMCCQVKGRYSFNGLLYGKLYWNENGNRSTASSVDGRLTIEATYPVAAHRRGLRWRCIEQLGRELLCCGRSRPSRADGRQLNGRLAGRASERQIVIRRCAANNERIAVVVGCSDWHVDVRLVRSTRTADSYWWPDCLVDDVRMTTRTSSYHHLANCRRLIFFIARKTTAFLIKSFVLRIDLFSCKAASLYTINLLTYLLNLYSPHNGSKGTITSRKRNSLLRHFSPYYAIACYRPA